LFCLILMNVHGQPLRWRRGTGNRPGWDAGKAADAVRIPLPLCKAGPL